MPKALDVGWGLSIQSMSVCALWRSEVFGYFILYEQVIFHKCFRAMSSSRKDAKGWLQSGCDVRWREKQEVSMLLFSSGHCNRYQCPKTSSQTTQCDLEIFRKVFIFSKGLGISVTSDRRSKPLTSNTQWARRSGRFTSKFLESTRLRAEIENYVSEPWVPFYVVDRNGWHCISVIRFWCNSLLTCRMCKEFFWDPGHMERCSVIHSSLNISVRTDRRRKPLSIQTPSCSHVNLLFLAMGSFLRGGQERVA